MNLRTLRRNPGRTAVTIAAIVIGVLLIGCGGNTSTDTPSSAPTGSTAPDASPSRKLGPEKLTVEVGFTIKAVVEEVTPNSVKVSHIEVEYINGSNDDWFGSTEQLFNSATDEQPVTGKIFGPRPEKKPLSLADLRKSQTVRIMGYAGHTARGGTGRTVFSEIYVS